jgi:hypothetical protein
VDDELGADHCDVGIDRWTAERVGGRMDAHETFAAGNRCQKLLLAFRRHRLSRLGAVAFPGQVARGVKNKAVERVEVAIENCPILAADDLKKPALRVKYSTLCFLGSAAASQFPGNTDNPRAAAPAVNIISRRFMA